VTPLAHGRLRTGLNRLRWELRTIAGEHPALCRRLIKSGEQVSAETEIVIEGFQRTGNTFAVIAFQFAQAAPLSVAHHVHAPGPVLDAIRLRKPALVLIREPEEAVLSFAVRFRELTLGQALRGYIRFYTPLLAHRARLVIGRFEEVTTDFGSVIRQVNGRFGTRFREYEHSPENLEKVLAIVDEWDLNTFGEGERLDQGRARPTEGRAGMKVALRTKYRAAGLASARRRAERLYETFVRR